MEWLAYLAIAAGAALVVMTLGGSGTQRHRTAVRLMAVERRLGLIMDHLGIVEPQPYLAEVIAHLERGKKLHAVKAYRDGSGVGLAEAKEAVERIARERGLEAS